MSTSLRHHTSRATTFGPGRLESVTLRSRGVIGGLRGSRQYRLDGTFMVYCGNGSEHTVDVSTEYGFEDAPESDEQLVDELIEWKLESWDDPCEHGTDD